MLSREAGLKMGLTGVEGTRPLATLNVVVLVTISIWLWGGGGGWFDIIKLT